MKKLVMAVATVAALSSAASASCASSFSGFYAGAQAGLGSTTGVNTENDTVAAAGFAAGDKQTFGGKSFVGGLFAGYGMGVGSCAYVGGELYANVDTLNANTEKNADGSYDEKIRSKYNAGAKVRLGYTVSQQAMVFVALGMEYSKYTNKVRVAAGNSLSGSKKNFVFAPSVGMDMFLSKNLFLRGEYTYAMGNKTSCKLNNGTIASKAKADQQRFMLGLGYKF
jgi:outer membrane immunogenic protein